MTESTGLIICILITLIWEMAIALVAFTYFLAKKEKLGFIKTDKE